MDGSESSGSASDIDRDDVNILFTFKDHVREGKASRSMIGMAELRELAEKIFSDLPSDIEVAEVKPKYEVHSNIIGCHPLLLLVIESKHFHK